MRSASSTEKHRKNLAEAEAEQQHDDDQRDNRKPAFGLLWSVETATAAVFVQLLLRAGAKHAGKRIEMFRMLGFKNHKGFLQHAMVLVRIRYEQTGRLRIAGLKHREMRPRAFSGIFGGFAAVAERIKN